MDKYYVLPLRNERGYEVTGYDDIEMAKAQAKNNTEFGGSPHAVVEIKVTFIPNAIEVKSNE